MRVLLIWLNFKLNMEKEITVESMFMNQDVLVLLPTAYEKNSVDITNVDYKWSTKLNTKAFARLPASSKTRLPSQACFLAKHKR